MRHWAVFVPHWAVCVPENHWTTVDN
jgi:hypothetical protein